MPGVRAGHLTPGRGSLSRGEPRPGPADVLALLEERSRDDPAWLLVVRVYLDGLREHPQPFDNRDVEHPRRQRAYGPASST